jgi:transcriptional regulator with XRE-family HTH domain
MEVVNMNIKRDWLVNLRNQLDLSQKDVADKIGISRSAYAGYETGRRDPSIQNAKAIAELLNFNWTIFFDLKRRTKTQKTA